MFTSSVYLKFNVRYDSIKNWSPSRWLQSLLSLEFHMNHKKKTHIFLLKKSEGNIFSRKNPWNIEWMEPSDLLYKLIYMELRALSINFFAVKKLYPQTKSSFFRDSKRSNTRVYHHQVYHFLKIFFSQNYNHKFFLEDLIRFEVEA